MSLYFEEEGAVRLPLPCEELAGKVIEAALDYVGCPYEAQVNLLLTTNEQIHEMNRQFRGIDRPTDVLSFPMVEYAEPGDFDFLEDREDCFDPESGGACPGGYRDLQGQGAGAGAGLRPLGPERICFLNRPFCVTLNRIRPYRGGGTPRYGTETEGYTGKTPDFTLRRDMEQYYV